MAAFASQEQRPMKRPRLSAVGPDVYPQDPKQKEDDLTPHKVKHGFTNQPLFNDEHGSAKHAFLGLNTAKLGNHFNSILGKKVELNTYQDQAKRKLQVNVKDNFWPVVAKSRHTLLAWMKDLAGDKPLTQLGKRVPIFNKKEEILTILCENNVPLIRGCWFVKMTNVYNVAISDAAKARKKQTMDPFSDWTGTLTRYLREQLGKIIEHYQGSSTQTSFLTAGPTTVVDIDLVMRQWTHGTQLARYMYEEGLLDRHEFLNWMLELLEKMKITDDTVLKLILAQVLKYTSDYVASQLLSRKLAHFCAHKLSQFYFESSSIASMNQSAMSTGTSGEQHASTNTPTGAPSTSTNSNSGGSTTLFAEYYNCPQHRSLIMSLSGILQTITVRCPGALVWHNLGESKTNSVLCDSPLDLLPVAPSSLPMPQGLDNHQIRIQLIAAENQIIARSRAAEMRWSSDRCQQSTTGTVIGHVLDVLEALDRHVFDKVEPQSSLDTLYHKVFGGRQSKEEDVCVGDEPIVKLLCEWAVSTQRTGVHRAVVVAKLLEKRQNDMTAEKFASDEMGDERDSVTSEVHGSTSSMPFQNLLKNFLDTNAPVLDMNPSIENRTAFANLICLMCELVAYDVFSHDAYMCSLISHGNLMQAPLVQPVAAVANHEIVDLSSVKSDAIKQEEMKQELENQVLDSGFEIFGLKDEPKSSPDGPASVKSEQPMSAATPGQVPTPAQAHTPGMARTPGAPHTPGAARTPGAPLTPGAAHTPGMATTPGGGGHTPGMAHTPGKAHTPISSGHLLPQASSPTKGSSRHLIYATHFPIPQDELSSHECNQRMVVLFGVGKARDEARHVVKKITKEIMKLYGKKNSIDTSSGDTTKMKRKKEKDALDSSVAGSGLGSLEGTFAKFQKLSYYDQHAITATVRTSVVEMVNGFATGNANYLPPVDHISFLLDLMEYCNNINGLVDFVLKLSRELPEVETQLQQKMSSLAGVYSTSVCLYLVAVLRKYHAYLLVCQEHTADVFESLCKVVKHVCNPSDCTSAERVILAYRYELYTQCFFLRMKYNDTWGTVVTKVQNTLYPRITPSACNQTWDPGFMIKYLQDPKLKLDPQLIKELNDSVAQRYKLVCNAIREVCLSGTPERVNEVSIVCANITACCNILSSDWLGVLKALCWSSNHGCGFIDVLTTHDSSDLSIHDNLAVFTAVLVARHCFTLEDLVKHVALHSLLLACPSTGTGGEADAEPGARLTCHLLLRLFQTSPTLPAASLISSNAMVLKSSCDRHLLEAARNSITVGAVVAVLKAILMLGDSCNARGSSSSSMKKEKSDDIISSMLSSLDDGMDMDMDLAMIGGPTKIKGGFESAGLSEYAKHCLKEICSQEWVREKFLKNPKGLFDSDLLLDKMVSHRQAQQLVQMICYPGGLPSPMLLDEDDDEEEPEEQRHITRILQSMDMWSMRVSWVELELMIKQATNSQMSVLLENIARGTIEVFQRQTECKHKLDASVSQHGSSWIDKDSEGVWLMAPLISKLSSAVQGKVLKTAGQVLETGNNFWSAKNSKDREKYLQKSTSLLAHQPFLSLVFACLRGQDEQRECLLKSLQEQLEKFVSNAKEQQDRGLPTDDRLKSLMQEALQLRLSLVGGMFDTIQRNNNLVQDWAALLMQLVSHGVVDISNNSELFTVILDMLSVLIHGTLVSENSEKGEESKKSYTLYHSLIRKLKRELGEKHSASIDQVRQLLPLPKLYCEVLQCEPHSLAEGKNRGPEADERRLGVQICNKQKVSPWEMIEGQKNLAPLSLAWFGAVRSERKPLKYEEEHRLLLYHTHTVKKPTSFFLEPPPLPPEDLEPLPQEKPQEEKAVLPVVESKHNDSGKTVKPSKRGRNRRGSPRITTPTPVTYNIQGPMAPMGAQFGRQEMYHPQATNNWYSSGQPAQPQQTGQYMPPQHLPPGGPRFAQPNSKAALSQYLRARQPSHQTVSQGPAGFMGGPHTGRAAGPPPADNMMMLRARIGMHRQTGPGSMGRMGMSDGGMYGSGGPSMAPGMSGPSQGFPQPMAGQSMNQGYSNYTQGMGPQQPGMDSAGGNMVAPQQPGYSQGYPGGAGAMQRMPGSTQAGPFIQPPQSGQYNTPTSRYTAIGGMGNISGTGAVPQGNSMPINNNMGQSMTGYNPGGPQTTGSGYTVSRQQMMSRQQQVMSAMQQGSQQQQQHQQVRAMYPQQMQRQLSGGGTMGQQGGAPGGNFYQQY